MLRGIAGRGSCRAFFPDPIDLTVIETLCAVALSATSKSDLKQRDIVIVDDPKVKLQLLELVSAQTWTSEASSLLIFCANNRRQRQIHEI